MSEPASSRRRFLESSLASGAALVLGAVAARADAPEPQAPTLSKEEKAKLKSELQLELERRVYSVDETMFRKVNRAKDPKALAGHEKSHVPRLVAPTRVRRLEAFQIRIEVGPEEIHEMNTFHYVDWISLAIDGVQVNHATVTPLFNRPIVTFEVVLERSATLTAQEHCNLHGTWESEPIVVEVV